MVSKNLCLMVINVNLTLSYVKVQYILTRRFLIVVAHKAPPQTMAHSNFAFLLRKTKLSKQAAN